MFGCSACMTTTTCESINMICIIFIFFINHDLAIQHPSIVLLQYFWFFFFCMLSGYILFVSRFSTFPFINARCVCGRRAKLCGIWRRINMRGGKTPLFSIPRVCFALFLFKYNYHNSVVVDVQILPKKKTHTSHIPLEMRRMYRCAQCISQSEFEYLCRMRRASCVSSAANHPW